MSPLLRPARSNPFASRFIERLEYRFFSVDLSECLNRFRAMNLRGALVGPQGHGKTTLQELIAAEFEKLGDRIYWIKIAEGQRKLSATDWWIVQNKIGQWDLMMLDGVEQLSWWEWRRFLKVFPAEKGCLITIHKPGRLPTLLNCETSESLLIDLVEQLTSRTTEAEKEELKTLYQKHSGDIRQCFRELYDRWARSDWQ